MSAPAYRPRHPALLPTQAPVPAPITDDPEVRIWLLLWLLHYFCNYFCAVPMLCLPRKCVPACGLGVGGWVVASCNTAMPGCSLGLALLCIRCMNDGKQPSTGCKPKEAPPRRIGHMTHIISHMQHCVDSFARSLFSSTWGWRQHHHLQSLCLSQRCQRWVSRLYMDTPLHRTRYSVAVTAPSLPSLWLVPAVNRAGAYHTHARMHACIRHTHALIVQTTRTRAHAARNRHPFTQNTLKGIV